MLIGGSVRLAPIMINMRAINRGLLRVHYIGRPSAISDVVHDEEPVFEYCPESTLHESRHR